MADEKIETVDNPVSAQPFDTSKIFKALEDQAEVRVSSLTLSPAAHPAVLLLAPLTRPPRTRGQ